MNSKTVLLVLSIHLLSFLSNAQAHTFQSVPKDPTGTRVYTLSNGLTVYLSQNKEEPRIQTYITVKTGSKNDPADVTGLAHYLEHMVFKGTSKYGTLNWEKEKVLLNEISALFEQHKHETNPEKKKVIYSDIDKVSGDAARYAIANEYPKMISALGARGTNAFTSLEVTSYLNDLPSTELEKWLKVESERFGELVLRLFHTELEAVYEEFNMGQDNDFRKAYKAMNELLFPTHPYGTQSTIGTGEHLKNPSMEKIHAYFKQYYVPNNMAICIAGDLDYDLTIALVDKYFGSLRRGNPNPPAMPTEKPQTEIKSRDVIGPDSEWVTLAWRTGGYHTKDALMADIVSSILSNGQAGLIDLNLLQKQAILDGYAYSSVNHDYGQMALNGKPKDGQTLEELRDLLLAEVNRLKRGEFSDQLLSSIYKNNRKNRLAELENNSLRASEMSRAFVMEAAWSDFVNYNDRLEKITRTEIIKWANENIKDNYCILYKRTGEDKSTFKVDKPQITPIDLNRADKSDFFKEFEAMESLRLEPQFIDYTTALQRTELAPGVPFFSTINNNNDLFELIIELDEEMREDKKVALAMKYLAYLGTDKYSAEEIKQKFYSLGTSYYTFSNYIMVSGLNESFEESLVLLEHLLTNCRPDATALKNLVADVGKERENQKLNKNLILQGGLRNYAMYGPKNPFNSVLTMSELEALQGQDLCAVLSGILGFRHTIFYYGKSDHKSALNVLRKQHKLPESIVNYKYATAYPQLETKENLVYFIDYDMVQTMMLMLSKDEVFNPDLLTSAALFNSYFGSGLSSVVFQEIRESKALAYGANAFFSRPGKPTESHYVNAFLSTQSNKLSQAVDAMKELMNSMPRAEIQFEGSKVASLKQIESDRITKSEIFWEYLSAKRMGLNRDVRKEIYTQLPYLTLDDLANFFDRHIKARKFTYCVIGKKSDTDMVALSKLGTVKELTLEELFGY